jgi:hypothetical protein
MKTQFTVNRASETCLLLLIHIQIYVVHDLIDFDMIFGV